MDGIALAYSDLPVDLFERHQFEKLVHDRGGERAIRFARHVRNAVLPVNHEGQTLIVP